jgi:Rieske Fe-S protein
MLISAKCTHLGCTVGSEVNAQGKILCPCHISYFDVKTGVPDVGAPAKAPLKHLSWVMMDAQGKLVASQGPEGPVKGTLDPAQINNYSVYIVRPTGELS